MNINFEKLDWIRFQDLCADILILEGFTIVKRSGIGSDRGMDLLVKKEIEFAPGCTKPFRWLVQCKHKIKQGSLKPIDIGDFISDLPRHNADGFWLMTNANLSTSLEDKITSLNEGNSTIYKATYSDRKLLEDYLFKYRGLLSKYFNSGTSSLNTSIDWKKVNPYRELQAYTEADKDFFFGREKEIEELLGKIYKDKIVGLFGESGSGKTSIINAGLLPVLKSENFIVVSVRCLDEPIKRIRETLLNVLKQNHVSQIYIDKLAIADSFAHMIIELKSLINKENINLIILIDQMEELFTRANEREKEQLSKGIFESLIQTNIKGRLCFLVSLREDYIGELWDWSHKYNLEDAWIQTYRISRLKQAKAIECIINPLKKLGIRVNQKFIENIVNELTVIGGGHVYPPYLQILCTKLFEEFKNQNKSDKTTKAFDKALYENFDGAESIIAEYLSESMLEGLTEDEKLHAENILDVLTGPEGLRAFLNLEDISRNIGADQDTTQHVIEHLTRKKIVHPVVEKDLIVGYELVHDFLSKKFFEKLSKEAKLAKTTIELFRKAFKEWKDHKVLASKDRLNLLAANFDQLTLNDEELLFLVKSSFSVFWFYDGGNKLMRLISEQKIATICKGLLNDEDPRIIQEAIRRLGGWKKRSSN